MNKVTEIGKQNLDARGMNAQQRKAYTSALLLAAQNALYETNIIEPELAMHRGQAICEINAMFRHMGLSDWQRHD